MGFTHVELMPVAEHPYSPSWGYQVTVVLRAHLAVRIARRLPVPRRRPAPGRASACSWTGCPAHFPKDTWALARFDGTALYEHADPRRGEQPDWGTLVFDFGRTEVRNFLVANAHLLARGVPHRRPAGGRRGLDALPGLLAQRGRVAAQPVRRPREPRRGGVPAGDERDRVQARARGRHHRRGVDVLARRHPPDLPRRPGLRPEVEHGLDERLAGVHLPRARAPHVAPQRDDVLRWSTPGASTSACRSRTTRSCTARGRWCRRCPATGGRRWPTCGLPGLHVGPSGQAAALHGLGVRPDLRVERGARSGLVAVRVPGPLRRAALRARHEHDATARPPRCGTRTTPRTASSGSTPTTPRATCSPGCGSAATDRCWPTSRTSPPSCAATTGVGLPNTGRWVEVLNTDAEAYGGSGVGNLGGVTAEEVPWHGRPASANITLPPLATVWLRDEPEDVRRASEARPQRGALNLRRVPTKWAGSRSGTGSDGSAASLAARGLEPQVADGLESGRARRVRTERWPGRSARGPRPDRPGPRPRRGRAGACAGGHGRVPR